jgi:hypothetical protein
VRAYGEHVRDFVSIRFRNGRLNSAARSRATAGAPISVGAVGPDGAKIERHLRLRSGRLDPRLRAQQRKTTFDLGLIT